MTAVSFAVEDDLVVYVDCSDGISELRLRGQLDIK